MNVKAPHFFLFSESCAPRRVGRRGKTHAGQWRFVLEAVDGSARFEAEDEEPETEENRLELLAVVRALESLDQPSRVTVVSPSRYLSRGFRYGLEQWRENNWRWESYGEMTPIRNRDLWQRIDRAMRFHRVECRTWRFDPPEGAEAAQVGTEKSAMRSRSRPRTGVGRPHTPFESEPHQPAGGWWGRCAGLLQRFRTSRSRAPTA